MVSEPLPPRRRVSRELFGETLVDDYAWLRDREDPAVRAHVEAERDHAEATLDARTGDLRARLYGELRARIKEDERSAPSKDGPWLYDSRTELGDEYPRHCRRPYAHAGDAAGDRDVQVYLDENQLAEDQDYFDLATLAISPNHRLCAYMVDLDGDEIYTLRIKDLDTDELLADTVEGCGDALSWGDDGVLFYTRLDPSYRPWQVWRHALGSDQADDVCIYEEPDPKFHVSVYRTRSNAFVVLSIGSHVSSEMWLIPTSAPTRPAQLITARREGVEYSISHRGDQLFVLSNAGARNFQILQLPLDQLGPASEPQVLVAHRERVLLEDIDVFAGHLVIWERCEGLQRIRVVPLDPMPARAGDDDALAPGEHLLEFPDPTYSLWSDANPEFETTTLRFGYTSLTTPASTFDYDLVTRERTLRKREVVVGGHDPARYRSARIWASAGDGERVPISLVWRPDLGLDGRPRPTVLTGYGAYGLTEDPSFSRARLSLLDRGVVWAIAHVRGGGELGRRWHDAGKLAHKHNSFGDFIACAEHLISQGWTSPAQLVATGGSAGGLLVGAVANARPELFTAIVAVVPFVDVLNTMLDPSLPLTMVERDEWGDPNTAQGYAWIRAYAPYDNVRAQDYPAMFVLAAWNDPRVGYWESAKWVARLRALKTDSQQILLWTNMDAGHAGSSGRFEYLHEVALEYAFLIDHLGLPFDPFELAP